MADRKAGALSATPVEPGLLARIGAGLRFAATGQWPGGFFGPGQPIQPAAPEAAGRAFDYPAGYNLNIHRRDEAPITFEQLRGLADSYDLVRLAIETRKDQMAKLPWTVKRRDTGETDTTATTLIDFLQSPDQEHDFETWQRMLLEDVMVIDAPTVYPRLTLGGQLYGLEVIDGATIVRKLDATGRTPLPPEVAYQQVIKGVPAVDYTRDELLYRPRNVRIHRVYGCSPVQQIVMIVNIALRRQLHQFEYYREGNLPDALAGVPASWSTAQIETFQKYWDTLMSDDLAARRRVKFIPGELQIQQTRQEKLFDEYDEWLARVVMFAFSLPALPFVKQQNRATATTAQEAALEEGLAPLMQWFKRLVDAALHGPMGQPGYEFAWSDQKDIDPLAQAEITKIYIDAKVITPDEARDDLGKPPLTAAQKEELAPTPVAVPGQPADPAAPAPAPAQKLRKAASSADTRAAKMEGPYRAAAEDRFAQELADLLGLLDSLHAASTASETVIETALQEIDARYAATGQYAAGWRERFTPLIAETLKVGGDDVAAVLGVDFNLANPLVQQVISARAGNLVTNVTETTRDAIRSAIAQGRAAGEGVAAIAKRIVEATGGEIAKHRAVTIARTETIGALNAGEYQAAVQSGVIQSKEWDGVGDERERDTHLALNGVRIPLAERFANGLLYPGEAGGPPEEVISCRCGLLFHDTEAPAAPEAP